MVETRRKISKRIFGRSLARSLYQRGSVEQVMPSAARCRGVHPSSWMRDRSARGGVSSGASATAAPGAVAAPAAPAAATKSGGAASAALPPPPAASPAPQQAARRPLESLSIDELARFLGGTPALACFIERLRAGGYDGDMAADIESMEDVDDFSPDSPRVKKKKLLKVLSAARTDGVELP